MFSRYEVPVITYHSINNHRNANPLGIISFTVDEFLGHLRYLQAAGYEMISVKELVQRARQGQIGKKRIAVLTFDDGFLDSYLIVPKILAEFKATGTLFVNPGHAAEGPARTLDEHPNAWGFLNFEEMRLLEKQGILDVQSHTMTHDFSFVDDKVVDFYTPQKFSQYYWLIWKLHPFTKLEWHGDVYRFANLVPAGYPIFTWGRCMQSREFLPSKGFIDLCIKGYLDEGPHSISQLNSVSNKGDFESEADYRARIEFQLSGAKSTLEHQLSKTIDTVCFPGDVYDEKILASAAAMGHKIYMRHPRENGKNNLTALRSASGSLTGLRRLGLFSEYPESLPKRFTAYWAAKIAIRGFIEDPLYARILSVGRTAMQLKRKKLSHS